MDSNHIRMANPTQDGNLAIEPLCRSRVLPPSVKYLNGHRSVGTGLSGGKHCAGSTGAEDSLKLVARQSRKIPVLPKIRVPKVHRVRVWNICHAEKPSVRLGGLPLSRVFRKT